MSKSFSLLVQEATDAKPPLFFNMVQFTTENLEIWNNFGYNVKRSHCIDTEELQWSIRREHPDFSDSQINSLVSNTPTSKGYKIKNYDPTGVFMDSLFLCETKELHAFMAFASDTEVTELTSENQSSIEMIVTVTTSEHAPCSKHMGIARVMSYPYEKHHPGIALGLHGFAAKFIQDNFPGKIFMMTSPMRIMTEMITGALDKADMDSKYYYHSHRPIFLSEPLETRAKNKETRTFTDAKFLAQKMGLVPKDLSLSYDERTNIAKVFYKGDLFATIDSALLESKEFKWIRQEFKMHGATIGEHTIAVELDALARLAHFDEMNFYVDDLTALPSDAVYEEPALGGSGGGAASSGDLA